MKNRRQANILREKITDLPKSPGVYLFKDGRERVLYIGKAKDLRARVSSYFQDSADMLRTRGPGIAEMVEQVEDIGYLECESEVEALLQENRLIKDVQPPYNERLTDDKTYPYLEITTRDQYPGVYITRKPNPRSKLFGPFVNIKSLRAALPELQRAFKFRTCGLDIRENDEKRKFFRPCLLYAIKQCTAPCADRIPRKDYRDDIQRLIKFLSSKRSVVLRQMRRQMATASDDMDFETAAKLRDQIKAVESLSFSGKPDVHVQPEVFYSDPRRGMERLAKVLDLETVPRIIEGYDIATIQGRQSCGSLVCFIDGKPFKSAYKRFRIKSVKGVDDFAMMREVISRRFRHVAEGEELAPDMILIDGGLGQLHAASEALKDLDITAPTIIALAKREEEIYTLSDDKPIRLPRNDQALKLLQQVRDEAHRFAQHYHHILRRKDVLNESSRPKKQKKKQ